MAEFTSAEKVIIGYENEYSTDAMTGGPDKRSQLYYQLIQSMKKAESVDIIVSFLMESGVRMLLKELEHTLKRGAKIRILTGNYLGITQPSALYLIKRKLGDMRFYAELIKRTARGFSWMDVRLILAGQRSTRAARLSP